MATPTTCCAHSATTAERGVAPSPRGSLLASTYLFTSEITPSPPSSPPISFSTEERSEDWSGRTANELGGTEEEEGGESRGVGKREREEKEEEEGKRRGGRGRGKEERRKGERVGGWEREKEERRGEWGII